MDRSKDFAVKILADTQLKTERLTTFQLTYPRYIHSEVMTHRVFSRNASSSRAIPTKTLLDKVRNDPVFFVSVGQNKAGMQAGDEISEEGYSEFYKEWKALGKIVADTVEKWADKKIHKQVINRALEPWLPISVVLSSTKWDNFFGLRCHKDAQPEFQHLASLMRQALEENTPTDYWSYEGSYHLPYVTLEERECYNGLHWLLMSISAARCARVSYNIFGEDRLSDPGRDVELVLHKLLGDYPYHMSPFEHPCAVEVRPSNRVNLVFHSNFSSTFIQFRKLLEDVGPEKWRTLIQAELATGLSRTKGESLPDGWRSVNSIIANADPYANKSKDEQAKVQMDSETQTEQG